MLSLESWQTANRLLRFVEWEGAFEIGDVQLTSPAAAAFMLGDLIELRERGERAAATGERLADGETVALIDRLGVADAKAAEAILDDLESRGVETDVCRRVLAAAAANVPNPPLPISAQLRPLTIGSDYSVTSRPMRRFVAPGLQRGKVAGWASAPGVGKSTLALQTALAVIAECDALIGGPVDFAGPVIAVMNEDDQDEIGRRVDAVLKGFGLNQSDLKHQLHIFGASSPLVLFERANSHDPLRATAQFNELAGFVQLERPALVIIDTLSSSVRGADENNSSDMQAIMSGLSKLAAETDTAFLVITHTAKAASGRSGDQHAVRGSSAITGAMRSVSTLAPLGEDGAKKLGLPPTEAHSWVRMDAAKANYGPTGQTAWFEREVIKLLAEDPRDPTLPVFETVAILRPRSQGPSVGLAGLDLPGIVEAIRAGFDGHPPLSDIRAKESGLHTLLQVKFGLDRIASTAIFNQLLRAGVVVIEKHKHSGSRHVRNVVVVAPDADAKLAAMQNTQEGDPYAF
jgi:hypothetical protein